MWKDGLLCISLITCEKAWRVNILGHEEVRFRFLQSFKCPGSISHNSEARKILAGTTARTVMCSKYGIFVAISLNCI